MDDVDEPTPDELESYSKVLAQLISELQATANLLGSASRLSPELNFDDWVEKTREIVRVLSLPLILEDLSRSTLAEFQRGAEEILAQQRQIQAKRIEVGQRLLTEGIWEQIVYELERMTQDYQDLSAVFSCAGFWLTDSMPESIWAEVKIQNEQGLLTPDSLKNLILHEYRENDGMLLKEMVDRWCTNEHFARRKHILNDALEAHLAGKYTLSVPALLPQIEGIAVELAEVSRSDLAEALKRIGIEIAKTGTVGKHTPLAPVTSEPFKKETEKLYGGTKDQDFNSNRFPAKAKKSWGRDLLDLLNRPAILHGVQIDYDSIENSLRAFLFLDSLYQVANERNWQDRFTISPISLRK